MGTKEQLGGTKRKPVFLSGEPGVRQDQLLKVLVRGLAAVRTVF